MVNWPGEELNISGPDKKGERDNLGIISHNLQIRRGERDNLGIISHNLNENIFCYPSLEPSL